MQVIDLHPLASQVNESFELICQQNPHLKLEFTTEGVLVVMSPTGGDTGNQNSNLIIELGIWNKKNRLGFVFDSSTCFRLPNGGLRSPDVSWIAKQRWESLTPEQRKKFPPMAPDFVIELMSPTDSLKDTQAKMAEYISAGVKLGWLIDPGNQTVEIYRLGQNKEILIAPEFLLGEEVLPGFSLKLTDVIAG